MQFRSWVTLVTCIILVPVVIIVFLMGASLWNNQWHPLLIPPIKNFTTHLSVKEADLPTRYTFPLFVIQNECNLPRDVSQTTSILSDFQATVQISNAIFVRSNADFKWQVAHFDTLITQPCRINMIGTRRDIDQQQEEIYKAIKRKIPNIPNFFRIVIISDFDDYTTRQANGFAYINSTFVYIRKDYASKPSTVLAHELGHSMGLLHPFNDQFTKTLDLPRICTKEKERNNVLANCPKEISTCGESNEDLSNVMDYLPDRCISEFYFSPAQVNLMKYIANVF